MASQTLEGIVKHTQEILQPIFSKPKCSSKLLTKPPFRFIHDIVSSVKKSTGFPKAYFSKEELDSRHFKDKESKVEFLKKLAYVVGMCYGSLIDIRPSKVVAGLDPINTNVLLSHLGKVAVNELIDHDAAIHHCKNGGKIGEISFAKVEEAHKEVKEIESDGRLIIDTTQGLEQSNVGETKLASLELTPREENFTPAEAKSSANNFLTEEAKADRSFGLNGTRKEAEYDLKDKIQQCNGDVARTKDMIGSLINKPKCNEKLLNKPPFRFIHDVMMSVNRATGMGLEHVLSRDEMNSSKVNDKESKINFLSKLVSFVEKELGVPINLKPNKVVAGMEADNTRYFFQLFTLAAMYKQDMSSNKIEGIEAKPTPIPELDNKGMDLKTKPVPTSAAKVSEMKPDPIRKVDLKEVETKNISITNSGLKENSSSLLRHSSEEKESLIHQSPGLAEDDAEISADAILDLANDNYTSDFTDVVSKNIITSQTNLNDNKTMDIGEPAPDTMSNAAKDDNLQLGTSSLDTEVTQIMMKESLELKPAISISNKSPNHTVESTETIQKSKVIENNESVRHLFFGENDTEVGEENNTFMSSRPQTARRRPPRIKEKEHKTNQTPYESAENEKPFIFKDEDENDPLVNDNNLNLPESKYDITEEDKNQISNESKGIVGTGHTGSEDKSRVRFHLHLHNRQGGSLASSNKVKMTHYDLGSISQSIQTLARSSAPIGRVMDYLPQELDRMVMELNHWTEEYNLHEIEFEKVKSKTAEDLKPLQIQVEDVENEIQRVKQLIQSKKSQIRQNNEWIRERLRKFCER